jgi:hypothetical protein
MTTRDTVTPKKHRGPNRFTRTETVRLLRSAQAAGLPVERVEIDPHTGRISVIVGRPENTAADTSERIVGQL